MDNNFRKSELDAINIELCRVIGEWLNAHLSQDVLKWLAINEGLGGAHEFVLHQQEQRQYFEITGIDPEGNRHCFGRLPLRRFDPDSLVTMGSNPHPPH